MNPRLRRKYRLLIWSGAAVFFFLGVIGLFLPFLQGILFLLVAVYLTALVSARARLQRMRLRRQYPKASEWHDRAELWVKQQLARRGGNL